jgi:methylphosphotriester-DNA--protein-cysteine methyltransferase
MASPTLAAQAWKAAIICSRAVADSGGGAPFRTAAGEPPIQLLARVRLSQAAVYLTTTDLTLAAIAARTGYANCASLSKAFKRHYGVSPGSYRAAGRRPAAPVDRTTEWC